MRGAFPLRLCWDRTWTQPFTAYLPTPLTAILIELGFKGGLKLAETFCALVPDIPHFLGLRTTSGESEGKGEEGPTATPIPIAFQFTHGQTAWESPRDRPDARLGLDLWTHERRKHEKRP